MVKEPESTGREEPFGIDWSAYETGGAGSIESEESAEGDVEASGPTVAVEPPLPWREDTEYDPASTLRELLAFVAYGRRGPDNESHGLGMRPVPALIRPYHDLSLIRYDYPVCVTDTDPQQAVQTLREIVDRVIAEVAGEGDTGERLKRHVYQLESQIKAFADEDHGIRLGELWDRAAATLATGSELPEEKRIALDEDLTAARKALRDNGRVFPCDGDTPFRLFEAVVSRYWEVRYAPWRDELDGLVRQLQDVLAADFSRSPEAISPEHLEASAPAQEEVDFEAMSSLLKRSHLENPLREDRRRRIEEALGTLLRVRPAFERGALGGESEPDFGFPVGIISNDCDAVLDSHRRRMRAMVGFFRAVRVARLEVANGFRAGVHDEFFAQFDARYLTDEERGLCPPVLLRLSGDFVRRGDWGTLFEILADGISVKVLVELDDLYRSADDPTMAVDWVGRLAHAALAFGHTYVLQSPVSRPFLLETGFYGGLHYGGPAVFVVYKGDSARQTGLSTYLSAALAGESRVFPSFVFDPGRGPTWADRMDIGENPASDGDWSTDEVNYRDPTGEERSIDLSLTPAELLYCDERFVDHFWPVPPEKWHDNMVPVGDYLRKVSPEAGAAIPYIPVVDEDGLLGRVVMTRAVLSSVQQCLLFWRNLQELGGINNSFALKLLAQEKTRLEEAMQRDVASIEEKYVAQLDRDLAGLTEEIVRRIASQLLSTDGHAAPAMTTPVVGLPERSAAPTPAAAGEGEADTTEVEVDEEDDTVSFDEPYIDTPLCTSCNECTKLNGQLFAYNENKQAYIHDRSAGTYRDLVVAAELCPVHIIHPGKPRDTDEPGLDDLIERGARFN